MKPWIIIGGVIATILLVVVVGLYVAKSHLSKVLYPAAPSMPAEVSETMPVILVQLEATLKTNAAHVLECLQPGLTPDRIAELEKQYAVSLPEDIKSLYQWHNGSRPQTNVLDGYFIPTHRFMPLEEALEEHANIQNGKAPLAQTLAYKIFAGHRNSWIALFEDVAGDGYWYDLNRKPSEGSIFYNFGETGNYMFFPSARNLMSGIVKCYATGAFSVKEGSTPPQLVEVFQLAEKVWNEFGANNPE